MSFCDLVLAIGMEDIGCFLNPSLILDLPELLNSKLLIVSARLYNFWHQQSMIIIERSF